MNAPNDDLVPFQELESDDPGPSRLVDCPTCRGDGEVLIGKGNDPDCWGYRCPECGGRGTVFVEDEPVTFDDLDTMEAKEIADGQG